MSEGKKEILLGDCLELMKDIPNGSIDMILCDLPYGTTACKWDIVIPFIQLWCEYGRVIKDNGAIVLFASQPFTTDLINSARDIFRYSLVWEKSHGSFATAKKMPMKRHEDILIFCKGKEKYNPQMEVRDKVRDRRNEGYMKSGKGNSNNSATNPNIPFKYADDYNPSLSYPKSVLKFSNPSDKRLHPTQKPTDLFEFIIKSYTDENDLVLDNCAGSGTTAIACLNTNRQFIVMEKEQKYYDIILKRVGDFNKNFEPQTLFGNEM
jgi:site-specific DNA-methyltransferase (adenine-specific)